VNDIQRDTLILEIHGNTKAMKQKLDDHIANPVIHEVPPCDSHKSLVNRMWAIGVAAFSALVGVVWQLREKW